MRQNSRIEEAPGPSLLIGKHYQNYFRPALKPLLTPAFH